MTPDRLRHSRPLSLAVVLAFGVGLFGAWHHQATVLHGFCSDHGEQIHLDHDHDAAPQHAEEQTRVEEHHHAAGDHDCALLAFLSQSALRLQSPDKGAAPQDPAPPLDPELDAHTPQQIDLLLQSPKQSPPPSFS